MREVNVVDRRKKIYQLSGVEEFRKGEWLKDIPEDVQFLEVDYRSNNNILVISNMKTKSVKDLYDEGEKYGRRN